MISVVLYGEIVVKKEFKLQKRAVRIILDAPFFTHTQQLLDSLNWLPFRDRISYRKLILVDKILNNEAPNYLRSCVFQVLRVTVEILDLSQIITCQSSVRKQM